SLNHFSLHTENTTDEILPSGQKLQFGDAVDVFVQRPDRLQAKVKGDIRNQELFYDGKTITLFNHEENLYASLNAPPTIEKALDYAIESFGLAAPLADIIYRNVYDILTEDVTSGIYVGLHYVHGVQCHHLAFTRDDIDWQIWIENSQTPLPRKVIITEKWITGSPQFTALLSNWNLSPKFDDNLFRFVPPEKAKKIDFLPTIKSLPTEK
ncbi:MAG: DUF2092 domain-containing protein, partial [Deltaproteobacteria bacterium]|nr:DUF2092 domain-containing protein [Deltaproteobacteria bacterium]